MTDKPVVYSKARCGQCDATLRKLDSSKVDYTVVSLDDDSDAVAFIKEIGYLQAPVVYLSPSVHWSGYRPDLISEHL